jgi:hypothetical protein
VIHLFNPLQTDINAKYKDSVRTAQSTHCGVTINPDPTAGHLLTSAGGQNSRFTASLSCSSPSINSKISAQSQPTERYQTAVTMLPPKHKLHPTAHPLSRSLLQQSVHLQRFTSERFTLLPAYLQQDERALPGQFQSGMCFVSPCNNKCSASHCPPPSLREILSVVSEIHQHKRNLWAERRIL